LLIVTYWIPPLIDRARRRRDFNGGVVEISVIFRHDGPILALQMVKLSSLHVEGRFDDALHQLHSIELVIALRMGVSLSILAFILIFHFAFLPFGGNDDITGIHVRIVG
jgi:hypothetical protein